MHLSDAIESQIKPLELLERIGVRVWKENDKFTTACPVCGSKLWVQPSSFLCANNSCAMLTGSLCEVAAAYTKEKSFAAGAALIQRLFAKCIEMQPETTTAGFVSDYLKGVYRRRHLVDFIHGLSAPDGPMEKASLVSELERSGVHRDSCSNMIFSASSEEVTKLVSILNRMVPGELLMVPKNKPLLVVPYFSKSHEIVSVVLLDIRTVSTWRLRVDLRDFAVAFAGLWRQGPLTSAIYLHPEVLGAAMQNSIWNVHDPRATSIAYLFGSLQNTDDAQETVNSLDNVCCVHNKTLDETPANLVRLHRIFGDVDVLLHPENQRVPFDIFMFNALRENMRGGRLTSTGVTLLGSFNPQGEARTRLLHRFKVAGFPGAAEQLARSLYDVEVFRSERNSLIETPDGYKIRRGNSFPELISNFILRLKDNVSFGETILPHHTAEVCIDNATLTTIINGRLLDSPRELQEHIQTVAAIRGSQAVPMLRDHGQFRNVAFYLRSQVPRLPMREGVPFLGWDIHRRAFYAPGWKVTMDNGLVKKYMPFHPDVQTLDCFTSEIFQGAVEGELDKELSTFIQMVVGTLIRAHSHMGLQCIEVRHDEKSLNLLAGLFKGLGQTRPLPKIEKSNPALCLFPSWTTATMLRTPVAVTSPYFVLSGSGRFVNRHHSSDSLDLAASVLQRMAQRVCETLLSSAEPAKHVSSVLFSNGLVLTAHEFIKRHYEIEMPLDIQPFAWVEKWLKLMPTQELPTLCQYNYTAQKITVDASKFADKDRKSVV